MTTHLRRMDEIEGWRQKAFALSRTDRLGRLITKTFDLIQTVVRDGPNAEILVHEVECLHTEQTNAIMAEPNLDDTHRSLLYGLSASLGIMIESMNERNLQMKEDSPVVSKDRNLANVAQTSQDDDLEVVDVIGPKKGHWMHKTEPEIQYLRTKRTPLQGDRSVRFSDRVVVNKYEEPAENDPSRKNKDNSTIRTSKRNVAADSVKTEAETREPPRKRSRIILTRNVTDDKTSRRAAATASKAVATSPKTRNPDGESLQFSCNQCDKAFNSLKNLNCHKNTVHTGIQCGDCGVRIKNHANLCKHYADVHPGRSPFAKEDEEDEEENFTLQCSHCSFRAEYHSRLKQHLISHTGVYTCTRCPSSFTKHVSLRKHMSEKHPKSIECDTCGNEFRSRNDLYNHCQDEHSVK